MDMEVVAADVFRASFEVMRQLGISFSSLWTLGPTEPLIFTNLGHSLSSFSTASSRRANNSINWSVVVQRHWRKVQDYRKARATQERMKREGLADEAANNMMTTASHEGKNDVFARLSNREVEFYREVFEKIDVDDSGQIDAGEVLRPLRSCCLE